MAVAASAAPQSNLVCRQGSSAARGTPPRSAEQPASLATAGRYVTSTCTSLAAPAAWLPACRATSARHQDLYVPRKHCQRRAASGLAAWPGSNRRFSHRSSAATQFRSSIRIRQAPPTSPLGRRWKSQPDPESSSCVAKIGPGSGKKSRPESRERGRGRRALAPRGHQWPRTKYAHAFSCPQRAAALRLFSPR